MCFGSENHSLLFHGCQLIAGRLWPDAAFANTGRTGAEQAALGARRIADWLAHVEPHGFHEFLSSTYMPLTLAALMNVVDFSGDVELSRRAAALADRIFQDVAGHAFDGVTIAPQGRVYRNVLYPEASGTQAILSFGCREAAVAYSDWLVFVASSGSYEPPTGLDALMREPVRTVCRQEDVEICLEKTADWLLTSLAIPPSFDRGSADGAAPNVRSRLLPGVPGYQQHLWQATLGRGCHVFVNHPGASFDQSSSRPGYWYGNGTVPRLEQREGLLVEIFAIPDDHPMPFTHAHWPADAFDRSEVRGHWAFGARGAGAVALWCSEPLEPHDEVLTGRELRAWGRRVAWLCVCGGGADFGAFVQSCEALSPTFDPDALTLGLAGQDPLAWAPEHGETR